MRDLQLFINEVQARNIDSFPASYDRMAAAHPSTVEQLQMIDLRDFMEEPTEGDYQAMKRKIKECDEHL